MMIEIVRSEGRVIEIPGELLPPARRESKHSGSRLAQRADRAADAGNVISNA